MERTSDPFVEPPRRPSLLLIALGAAALAVAGFFALEWARTPAAPPAAAP